MSKRKARIPKPINVSRISVGGNGTTVYVSTAVHKVWPFPPGTTRQHRRSIFFLGVYDPQLVVKVLARTAVDGTVITGNPNAFEISDCVKDVTYLTRNRSSRANSAGYFPGKRSDYAQSCVRSKHAVSCYVSDCQPGVPTKTRIRTHDNDYTKSWGALLPTEAALKALRITLSVARTTPIRTVVVHDLATYMVLCGCVPPQTNTIGNVLRDVNKLIRLGGVSVKLGSSVEHAAFRDEVRAAYVGEKSRSLLLRQSILAISASDAVASRKGIRA